MNPVWHPNLCLSKVLDYFPEVLAKHQRAKMLIYSSKIFGCSCELHHTFSLICREPYWEHLKLLFFFFTNHPKKRKKKERMLRESLWWYKQVCTSKHTQFKQLLRLWDEMYYRCAHRRRVSNWWRRPFDKQEERTDNLLSLPSSSVTHATPRTNISIRAALLML